MTDNSKNKNSVWNCNKCGKTEKILMNGFCVICYHAKKGEKIED